MSRLRTLLVDDNPEFLDAAAEIVRGVPALDLCGVARSGIEALSAVGRLAPDLVLLDVRLGDVNGFLIGSAIRAAMPECRVLMMSLHDGPAYRSRSREIGAAGFLPKSELGAGLPAAAAALAAAPPIPGNSGRNTS